MFIEDLFWIFMNRICRCSYEFIVWFLIKSVYIHDIWRWICWSKNTRMHSTFYKMNVRFFYEFLHWDHDIFPGVEKHDDNYYFRDFHIIQNSSEMTPFGIESGLLTSNSELCTKTMIWSIKGDNALFNSGSLLTSYFLSHQLIWWK